MSNNIIIIFVIIFIIFIISCSSSTISLLGTWFGSDHISYQICEIWHMFSPGGLVGTESECYDPNGLNIPGGSPCPNGQNKDCLSGHCNCSFPHNDGDTCYCAAGPDDPKLPGGTSCPSGDNNLCRSGHCNCSFGHSTGDTCFCTTSEGDAKLVNGSPCPSGDDNICQSDDCDCDFPNNTGDTCFCGGPVYHYTITGAPPEVTINGRIYECTENGLVDAFKEAERSGNIMIYILWLQKCQIEV